jgi:hypothetical protein
MEPLSFWAAIVTMVIWVALTVISVLFMTMHGTDALGSAIFIILMTGMGIGGTAVVWENIAKFRHQEPQPTQRRASRKDKRRTSSERIERLIEVLDDDEIIELETLLLAREDDAIDYP